jgi:hypothetical protein
VEGARDLDDDDDADDEAGPEERVRRPAEEALEPLGLAARRRILDGTDAAARSRRRPRTLFAFGSQDDAPFPGAWA